MFWKKKTKDNKISYDDLSKPIISCDNFHFDDSLYIHLNVGGWFYTTTLNTLRKIDSSMLSVMFSNKFPTIRDQKTGYVFIDRDGELFKYILSFLRTGIWDIPNDLSLIQRLMIESDYYCLPFYWNIEFKLNDKGIFSYLRRKKLFFKNIQIVSSNKNKKQKQLRRLLGMDKLNDHTEKGPRAYMRIDLLNLSILPTHYSIRHNASRSYGALRGWLLLGENPKTGKWDVLKKHVKDQSLHNKSGSIASWRLSKIKHFYSSFMIKSLPDYGSINLSNIEMYGYVKPLNVQINCHNL